MKKKLVCLGLALLLGAALTACGKTDDASMDGKEALAAVKSLQENLRTISSAQIHAKIESTMKSGDASKTTTAKTEVKAELAANQNKGTDMKISQKETIDGVERQSTIYIKGKQAYLDTGTEKIRAAADQIPVTAAALGQYLLDGINEETLKNLDKKEEKDEYVYQLTVDDGQFMEYLGKIAVPSGAAASDTAADIEKLELRITADQGNIPKTVQMDCVYSMDPDSNGEKPLRESYQAQIEYRGINSGLTIDFPDFNRYKAINTEK